MDFGLTLDRLRKSGNFRTIPRGGRDGVIDFSTNDYLGIGTDINLQREFMDDEMHRSVPLTSSASRLLASHQDEYLMLEAMLRDLYGREALLFNSGYHANTGLVSALADRDTVILADRLIHASIIDGIVLSKARFSRFRHNDYAHLEALVQRYYDDCSRILVIAEGIYSMDGDQVDVGRLVELKKRYDKVMLYVDEAHSFGVCGPHGLGLVEACRQTRGTDGNTSVDVVVGTFGKAIGSYGAFCIASEQVKDIAVNTARSFIFSTALPPLSCAWTRWILEKMTSMDSRRERLRELSSKLQSTLRGVTGIDGFASHIQPLVVGDPVKAVELSKSLADKGVKVLPIRTPTVPPGTERLRFSLSASITDQEMNIIADALHGISLVK